MNLSPDGGVTPAPRRHGSLEAMNAAYESGMRFDGDIDIPVIDWRHYLEEQLDMHHSHQSFATRRRLQIAHGNADNQVIWFTDARPAVAFDQTPEAFAVMDEWMTNIRQHPKRGVAGNKPARAVDRCFTTAGREIAAGDARVGRRPRRPAAGRRARRCSRPTAARAAWRAARSRAASSSAGSRAWTRRSRPASTAAGCRAPPSATA